MAMPKPPDQMKGSPMMKGSPTKDSMKGSPPDKKGSPRWACSKGRIWTCSDQIKAANIATEQDDLGLGGGDEWSALQAEVKNLTPYAGPSEEYMPCVMTLMPGMPLEGVGSRALPMAAKRVRVSKRPVRSLLRWRDPNNPNNPTAQMKGIELFRAAVRLVITQRKRGLQEDAALLTHMSTQDMHTYMADVQAKIEAAKQHHKALALSLRALPALPALPALLRDPSQPIPIPMPTPAHRNDHKERAAAIKSSVGGFTTLMTLLRLQAHQITQQVTQQVTEGGIVTLEESVQDALDGQRQLTPLTCIEIRYSEIYKQHTHITHVHPSSHSSHSSTHHSILSLIHGPISDLSVLEGPQPDSTIETEVSEVMEVTEVMEAEVGPE
ncbi:hypothetical protein B484DRAFT_453071 [Ochromonadaceae sp. CCMP2298]|nr:hypothetical protein B484DRAFT_453071 [Ochromonadaceae sp. CCMP2298]